MASAERSTMPEPSDHARRFDRFLLIPFLLVLVLSVFQGSFHPIGDDWELFVDFDRLSFSEAVLAKSSVEDGLRFRPVAYGMVWLERHVFGMGFAAEAWLGLVLLGACGAALYSMLRRMEFDRWKSLGAASFYVLHPSLAEVHAWASCRVDLMATGLGLFALSLMLARRAWLGGLLFLLAFLSKESSWPLSIGCVALGFLMGRKGRSLLPFALAPFAALALTLLLKLLLVGKIQADWWFVDIPLSARIAGYFSYLRPLLWHPWTEASGTLLPTLALAIAGSIFFVMARPLRRFFPPRDAGDAGSRGKSTSAAAPHFLRPLLALFLLFALCLAVTGGVPVRNDYAGARLWFLPAAFFVASLALLLPARVLLALCLPAVMLLQLQLGPYRVASAAMGRVLTQLDEAIETHGPAVRVRGLPEYLGPVPLFALMPHPYMARYPGKAPEDRPLLSLDCGDREKEDRLFLDARWRRYMQEHGRSPRDYHWDRVKLSLAAEGR